MKKLNKRGKKLLKSMLLSATLLTGITFGVAQWDNNDNHAYADLSGLENIETANQSTSVKPANVLYEIRNASHDATNIIPLYVSHSDSTGFYLTYAPTDLNKSWDTDYWFISSGTLKAANIDSEALKHNSVINGVYDKQADAFLVKATK